MRRERRARPADPHVGRVALQRKHGESTAEARRQSASPIAYRPFARLRRRPSSPRASPPPAASYRRDTPESARISVKLPAGAPTTRVPRPPASTPPLSPLFRGRRGSPARAGLAEHRRRRHVGRHALIVGRILRRRARRPCLGSLAQPASTAATSAMMTMRVMDFLGVIGRSRPGSHRSRPASLLEIGVR